MRRFSYTVTTEYDGKSLLELFKYELHLSGYLIKRNKHIYNAVTVNGIHSDVRTILHDGDKVSILLSDIERKSNVKPMPGKINIVYEDEDIIVLNKSASDIVHPDHSHLDNTLGNYLVDYFIKNNDPADFHPVHRLDNGTSGLIVFAKHTYAQNILSESIHSKSFSRYYIALCNGIISDDYGIIDAPIIRMNNKTIKRCVDQSGQDAVTEYHVIKRFRNMTLVKIKLYTGRTHQIRVHMSYAGHPLVGDSLYEGPITDILSRPALHSYEIDFIHPLENKRIHLTAPLPEDIQAQIMNITTTSLSK